MKWQYKKAGCLSALWALLTSCPFLCYTLLASLTWQPKSQPIKAWEGCLSPGKNSIITFQHIVTEVFWYYSHDCKEAQLKANIKVFKSHFFVLMLNDFKIFFFHFSALDNAVTTKHTIFMRVCVCVCVCKISLPPTLILKMSCRRSCPEQVSQLWPPVSLFLSPPLCSLGPLPQSKAFLLAINLTHRADSCTHLWWLASANGSLVPTKYSHNSWKDFVTLHWLPACGSWIKQKRENKQLCLDC